MIIFWFLPGARRRRRWPWRITWQGADVEPASGAVAGTREALEQLGAFRGELYGCCRSLITISTARGTIRSGRPTSRNDQKLFRRGHLA